MGTSDPARLAVGFMAYGTDQLLDLADEGDPVLLVLKMFAVTPLTYQYTLRRQVGVNVSFAVMFGSGWSCRVSDALSALERKYSLVKDSKTGCFDDIGVVFVFRQRNHCFHRNITVEPYIG